MKPEQNSHPDAKSVFTHDDALPAVIANRGKKVRENFWKKLKRFAGRISFIDELVTAYFCAMDPQTPLHVRGILLAALAYFILPIDLVPDIIAGLGFADDAAVLAYAWKKVSEHIKPAHRAAAAKALEKELPGRPKTPDQDANT